MNYRNNDKLEAQDFTNIQESHLGFGKFTSLNVFNAQALASQLLSRFNVSFCMVTSASFPFELTSVIPTFNRFETSLGAIHLAM